MSASNSPPTASSTSTSDAVELAPLAQQAFLSVLELFKAGEVTVLIENHTAPPDPQKE